MESVGPGMDIRAQLTDAGESQIEDYLGRESTEEVQGTLLGVTGDSLFLEVWRADMVTTASFQAGRIRVPVATSEVLTIEQKEFSRVRSVGLVTVLLGGGFLLVTRVFGGSEGTGITGGGGGPIINFLPALFGGR